jgi:tyrosine-specific transport protein
MHPKSGSLIGGILLVAGTSIGGGMLALPVMTSLGGFWPSLVTYLFCWLFMMSTGLLLLEASLWFEGETNLVSMASRTLGWPGKIAAWLLYLFLFYSLTLAYIVGGGNLLLDLTDQHWGLRGQAWMGPLLFILLFAPVVYAGAKVVGRLNVLMMVGLIATFFLFLALGAPYVKSELLSYRNWSLSLMALPISFIAFAYQGIVPTLISYFHRNAPKARTAIIVGSFIPLVTYILWQWLILGIVPTFGEGGLAEAIKLGENAVDPLHRFIQNPLVYDIANAFAFFALLTSFFGVSLGLVDFLADGFQVKKTSRAKGWLCAIVFIPPLLLALRYPDIFLKALDYAGGLGCALLLGLMPILMVWVGRYRLGLTADVCLPGGKIILALLIAFVGIELICQAWF